MRRSKQGIEADAPPLDLAALAAVREETRARLRFVLHPSVRLVQSRCPILHIWQVNQPSFEGAADIDLDEGGESLLVARGTHGVAIERLSPGEVALLHAFAANEPLRKAARRAVEAEPSFDLSAALRRHVANQVLAGFDAQVPSPGEGER